MDYQHYPTPVSLAQRAWAKFTQPISRLLEPSAGKGDLVLPALEESHNGYYHHGRKLNWDSIEINPQHHARLRELGSQVVGHDFLAHQSCAIYSHILMNPPFAQGAQHVLHAWNNLFEGEIVAIINAETLKNAFSIERQFLLQLVQQHGSVEYIQNAFKGDDVERETSVEIALVHLKKVSRTVDIVGDLLKDLKKDKARLDIDMPNELALPEGFVELAVRQFNAAVLAAREAAIANAKAAHYAARLGVPLELNPQTSEGDQTTSQKTLPAEVARDTFSTQYDELKNRAWTQILRSTHVLAKLSSAAQKRVESEFETIKSLEFSTSNVYGFLEGLAYSANTIQMEMICDVFDSVARHHSENTVFYMGWKSNDKHRCAAMRIRHTRFIIPGHSSEKWQNQASWPTRRFLSDFDKVFAMLDGKATQQVSLENLFEHPMIFKELLSGKRLSSDYFDVRYYPQRGTIHFFPKNMEVVERLNRTVGAYRKWLPPSMSEASQDFRSQYEKAEKFDEAIRHTIGATVRAAKQSGYWGTADYAINTLFNKHGAENAENSECYVAEAIEQVLLQNGLEPFPRLATEDKSQQLMLV